jgi:hypothetical protein
MHSSFRACAQSNVQCAGGPSHRLARVDGPSGLLLHPEVDGQALKREGPPKRASLVFRCEPPVEPRQGEFGNVGAQRSLDGLANQFLQLPIRELVRLSFKAQHSTTGRSRRTCAIEKSAGPKPWTSRAVFERRTTNVNQFTACGLGVMIIVIYICAR